MSELSDMRQDARRLQRNASNKLSRLEMQGYRIRYSEFDPRQSLDKVDKYNRKQLNSYMKRLEQFNSRSNRFVMGADRSPIPQSLWNEYKRTEDSYNQISKQRLEKYGDIFDPNAGMSVGEREKDILPSDRVKMRTGDYKPYARFHRDSAKNIAGASALKTMIKDLKGRLSKKSFRRELKTQRFNAMEMFERLGNSRLQSALKDLTDEEFDLLWNFTDMASDAATVYDMFVNTRTIKSTVDSSAQVDRLVDRIEWAKQKKNKRRGS